MTCARIALSVALAWLGTACAVPTPPALDEQLAVRAFEAPATLRVGAAKVRITPDVALDRVTMIGYGAPRAARVVHRDLWARAIVLQSGETKAAFVTLDQLIVPGHMADAIESRLEDAGFDAVWVHATHTHSAPGRYWSMPFAELAMMGAYNEGAERWHVNMAEAAVRVAAAHMAPAVIDYNAVQTAEPWRPPDSDGRPVPVVPVNRNRRLGAAGETDDRLGRIAFRDAYDGHVLAQILTFAAHATVMPRESDMISPDWPGELARTAEAAAPGSVALVLTCAVGDAAPAGSGGDDQPHAERVERMATRLHGRLPQLRRPPFEPERPGATRLDVMELHVAVPLANIPAVPDWLFFIEYPTAALADTLWLPDVAQLKLLRIGPLLLAGWPSEPAMAHQLLLREAATAAGFDDAWLVSNVGGWFGYTLDAASYAATDGYEETFTLYPHETGDEWLQATQRALEILPDPAFDDTVGEVE